jgi:hypothetical protein
MSKYSVLAARLKKDLTQVEKAVQAAVSHSRVGGRLADLPDPFLRRYREFLHFSVQSRSGSMNRQRSLQLRSSGYAEVRLDGVT